MSCSNVESGEDRILESQVESGGNLRLQESEKAPEDNRSQEESEEDRLQKLQESLCFINNEIKAKIQAASPTSHRQFTVSKQKDPMASLEILIRTFFHWVNRRKLENQLGMAQSSYVEILNFSLSKTRLFTSVNQTMEHRLKKHCQNYKTDISH